MDARDRYVLAEMVISAARFAAEKGEMSYARDLYQFAISVLSPVAMAMEGLSSREQLELREKTACLGMNATDELAGINTRIKKRCRECFKSIFSG